MKLPAAILFFALAILCGAVVQAETATVDWIQQFGTSSFDYGLSVAVDAAGNAVIGGSTLGSLAHANPGGQDAFFRKFDRSGKELLSRQVGVSGDTAGTSVAIDATGNVYISGSRVVRIGGFTEGGDVFTTKFDSSGNELWTKPIGTSSVEGGVSMAVDAAGNAYISGYTHGSLSGANSGSSDAFLVKLDTNGSEVWTKQVGTFRIDYGESVTVDGAGYVYMSGYTGGSLGGENAGELDAFLAKFDNSGNQLWTQQIGTSSREFNRSVAVDAAGNVYIGGSTEGSLGGDSSGGWDAFLTKFDSNGSVLWTEQIGTSSTDFGRSVAVDAAGNAYLSGSTEGSFGGDNAGGWDAFLAKFDSSGKLLWTEQIGTSSDDYGNAVVIDAAGSTYTTGSTRGDLGGGNAGGWDAFLVKYRIVPEPTAAVLAAFAGVAGLAVRRRG